jgi:hypothetical protein
MANHIQNLSSKNEELKQTIKEIREYCDEKISYLSSSKFQGFLNNYVNADEAREMFQQLKNKL